MKLWPLLPALLSVLPGTLLAQAAPREEITIRSDFRPSDEPVTLERIWKLQPDEPNPHRARWAIERSLKFIEGPTLRRAAQGDEPAGLSIEGGEIRASTVSRLRDSGPWYREMSEFRCEAAPDDWFATREGARIAAEAASQEWDDILSETRSKLALKLARMRETTPERAALRAQLLFREWLAEAESEFKFRGRSRARMAEWRWYLHTAAEGGLCDSRHRPTASRKLGPKPTWKDMLAVPQGLESPQLLARAPAKRWNGLFTIRVSMDVAGRTLNGQFLVDSGAAQSVVSPDWLGAQGVNGDLIQVAGARPRRVVWTGGRGVARLARIEEARIANLKLPVAEFLMMQTALFAPPEHATECCDGIIGADVMRDFVVELKPGPPAEVLFWDRDGYVARDRDHRPVPWAEIHATARGDIVSETCEAVPEGLPGEYVPGVRWDTGSEVALDLHAPWKKLLSRSKSWTLACSTGPLAHGLPATMPDSNLADGPFQEKNPGATVGMETMGRGSVIFDLPHGRIWFSPESIPRRVPVNRSGMDVKFVEGGKGERLAVVKRLGPGPILRKLGPLGFKVGARLLSVDTIPIEELDAWEIEQRLSGVRGAKVRIGWRGARGFRADDVALR